MKDECYRKVKAAYDVFPSARASQAIAKCRKQSGDVRKGKAGENLKRWEDEKAEAELTQTQKHLIDANRGAQRNAHANRSLATKLNEALKRAEKAELERGICEDNAMKLQAELEKAEAELVDMRESLETKERVHRQDSEDLEKRLYAAEAQLSLSRLRPLAEAGFVAACIRQEIADRKWSGPYPFHEIASVMLAAGMNPMATYDREESEKPAHEPLADARQSARLLATALRSLANDLRQPPLPAGDSTNTKDAAR